MKKKPVHQCQCQNCLQFGSHPDKKIHANMNLLLSRLDEQQRRWYVAQEAEKIGHGGTKFLSQITGMHVNTIRRGRRELKNGFADRPFARVRLKGGGRISTEKKNPEIIGALKSVVENETSGDPMSEKKWVRRSLRQLQSDLQKHGYNLGHDTVGRLLKKTITRYKLIVKA